VRRERRETGDNRIDAIITEAIERIEEWADNTPNNGGIEDTQTDECVAYEVDCLLDADPIMHGGILLNRG